MSYTGVTGRRHSSVTLSDILGRELAGLDSMGIVQLNFTAPLSPTFQAYRVSSHRGRCTCSLLAALTLSALWTDGAGAQPASVVPPLLLRSNSFAGLPELRIGASGFTELPTVRSAVASTTSGW